MKIDDCKHAQDMILTLIGELNTTRRHRHNAAKQTTIIEREIALGWYIEQFIARVIEETLTAAGPVDPTKQIVTKNQEEKEQ